MNKNEKQEADRFYRLDDGRIFKCSGESSLFSYLQPNGEWKVSGNLFAKFFDSMTQYEEIVDPNVIENINDLAPKETHGFFKK